jgi:nicotinate-nucleotide pyrophosphorylase (carboxylating)
MTTKEFAQLSWSELLSDDCRHLVRLAVREDLDQGYDWTTVALVPEAANGAARLMAREHGVAAGLAAIPTVLDTMETRLTWEPQAADGQRVHPRDCLGTFSGNARDLLTTERIVLNLVSRLSGIASLAAQYVQHASVGSARVYDTRKTCPGYRRLDKYAARCGGAKNHRSGLFDAILIKDNHLAFGLQQPTGSRPTIGSPARAIHAARQFLHDTLPPDIASAMIIEIEVDSLEQLDDVLPASPDIVLLDNMTCEQLREAVTRRNAAGVATELEASGGVTLDTIADVSRTGVERISVGAITHSARALDLGLDWVYH